MYVYRYADYPLVWEPFVVVVRYQDGQEVGKNRFVFPPTLPSQIA
jgi:hypothetical protein